MRNPRIYQAQAFEVGQTQALKTAMILLYLMVLQSKTVILSIKQR